MAPDGTTDDVATLNTQQPGETAVWVVNNVIKSEAWGDAAAAPISADIGNSIVPRINDNGAEADRFEGRLIPSHGAPWPHGPWKNAHRPELTRSGGLRSD